MIQRIQRFTTAHSGARPSPAWSHAPGIGAAGAPACGRKLRASGRGRAASASRGGRSQASGQAPRQQARRAAPRRPAARTSKTSVANSADHRRQPRAPAQLRRGSAAPRVPPIRMLLHASQSQPPMTRPTQAAKRKGQVTANLLLSNLAPRPVGEQLEVDAASRCSAHADGGDRCASCRRCQHSGLSTAGRKG